MSNDFLNWKNYRDPDSLSIGVFGGLFVTFLAIALGIIFFWKPQTKIEKTGFQFILSLCLLIMSISVSYFSFTGIGDNDVDGINERFNYSWLMCLIIPGITSLTFYLLSNYSENVKEKLLVSNNYTTFLYFFILLIISLIIYGIIYSVHTMEIENNFFPIYNDKYENITSREDQDLVYKTLIPLSIVWVFSIFSKFNRNKIIENKNLSYILLFFSLVFLGLTIACYTGWETNFEEYMLVIFIGFLISTLAVYYIPDDSLQLAASLTLAFLFLITILYFSKNSLSKANENYSVYIIFSNFIISLFTIFTLIFIFYTLYNVGFQNLKNNRENNFIYWMFVGFTLLCSSLSMLNMFFSLNQKIIQEDSLNNTRYQDYHEEEYNIMNIFTFLFYTFTFLINLILLTYLLVNYENNYENVKLANFTLFKGNYGDYSLKEKIFFTIIILITFNVFYYFYLLLDEEKIYDADIKPETLFLPSAVLVVLMFINIFTSTVFKTEILRNNFLFSLLRFIILIHLYGLPLVLLVLNFIKKPKFYYKIKHSDKIDKLVFGDNKEKNAIPVTNLDSGDHSIFSVDSNFVNYGNGLFLTGGETNLDIEGLRGIRYVENQGSYYNFKYLTDDISSFQNIVKENDVNLFTLAINDASYGVKNDKEDAYWVAVGENVGLTDSVNNSIFYNTKAGTSDLYNVPEVTTLEDWKPAENTFNFKGSGVTSGSSSGQNIWVAVGQDSVEYSISGDSFNTIKYSEDGINWNNATGVSFSSYGNRVAFGPSGLGVDGGTAVETFVAVGYDYLNNNHIVYSHNGREWQAATGDTFSNHGNAVAYGVSSNGTSGIWVAVGVDDLNPIKYSVNGGTTWINSDNVNLNKQVGALDVIYNLKNKRFEVVGKKNKHSSGSGVLYHSQNGKEWSQDSSNLLEGLVEATALGYNKGINDINYDKVYYPEYSLNKYFFTDKRTNKYLDNFNLILTIFSIIIMILFVSIMTKVGKKNKIKKKKTSR